MFCKEVVRQPDGRYGLAAVHQPLAHGASLLGVQYSLRGDECHPVSYTHLGEDLADFGAWSKERENRLWEQQPPKPEDFGMADTPVQHVGGITEPKPREGIIAASCPKRHSC